MRCMPCMPPYHITGCQREPFSYSYRYHFFVIFFSFTLAFDVSAFRVFIAGGSRLCPYQIILSFELFIFLYFSSIFIIIILHDHLH
ncbi:hypothetical protein BDZ91DRAFT_734001 [Kalaharituber pfeilii]|nr:hypothetical protein BDZ91DRAFT_734001 [Kalaharituber pfeilii]